MAAPASAKPYLWAATAFFLLVAAALIMRPLGDPVERETDSPPEPITDAPPAEKPTAVSPDPQTGLSAGPSDVPDLSRWEGSSHTHNEPHNPETCAACIAEARLTPLRDEYADMRFDEFVSSHSIPESGQEALRDALGDLARIVIRDWSFAESRPLLLNDEQREEVERKLIDPILSPFPRNIATDP